MIRILRDAISCIELVNDADSWDRCVEPERMPVGGAAEHIPDRGEVRVGRGEQRGEDRAQHNDREHDDAEEPGGGLQQPPEQRDPALRLVGRRVDQVRLLGVHRIDQRSRFGHAATALRPVPA